METAESSLSKQLEDVENASRLGRQDAEKLVPQKVKKLAVKAADLAGDVAAEGVREFGAALLAAQGRLGINADWLREYTGLIASEVRDRVNELRTFRALPLPPWGQDTITRKAMHVCEEIIAERSKRGDHWICAAESPITAERTWPTIVQAWEAYKADENIPPAPQQCVPESVLRILISRQHRVEPQDVTWEQICDAGEDLCRHYGPVLVVPLKLEAAKQPTPGPEGVGTAQFWKEREDEFRKYDTAENHGLSAVWFSMTNDWSFLDAKGLGVSHSIEDNFKSLAREAATGLAGVPSSESWLDWLQGLRRARDSFTGRLLYSKTTSTGTSAVGTRVLQWMAQDGEPVPEDALIRFAVRDDPDRDQSTVAGAATGSDGVGIMLYWETSTETIEHLFATSANFCLHLRSVVSSPQVTAGKMREPLGDFEDRSGAVSTDDPVGPSLNGASIDQIVSFRTNLLNEYKQSTGNPSNSKIYRARNSGIHKPQFYQWLRGELSAGSETTVNFERFLREKKPPIPRLRPTKR
jgi:hypothetical protein